MRLVIVSGILTKGSRLFLRGLQQADCLVKPAELLIGFQAHPQYRVSNAPGVSYAVAQLSSQLRGRVKCPRAYERAEAALCFRKAALLQPLQKKIRLPAQ